MYNISTIFIIFIESSTNVTQIHFSILVIYHCFQILNNNKILKSLSNSFEPIATRDALPFICINLFIINITLISSRRVKNVINYYLISLKNNFTRCKRQRLKQLYH